jgi:guanylate kinase
VNGEAENAMNLIAAVLMKVIKVVLLMSNKEHVLLCVMAESSAGKDTLVNKLCELTNYKQLISYSTRPRRVNEGDTHIFVTEEDYQKMLAEGRVAAYTEINGYKYWSTIDQLYLMDIYVIDPFGVETLKKLNLPDLKIITAYINVPEEIRKQRALSRGDDINVYRSRALSERQQFRDMKKNMSVDYVIPNLELAKSVSVLKWICSVEGLFMNKEDTTE